MSVTARRPARAFRVFVDAALCDGCGICVFFCKPMVFAIGQHINQRGVFPAQALHAETCNNCRLCEAACPQLAIAIRAGEGGDTDGPA